MSSGRPRSRIYEIVQRIAGRSEGPIGRAFLAAVDALYDAIDEAVLRAALASGEIGVIEAAAGVGVLGAQLTNQGRMEAAVYRTAVASGTAVADVLAAETGLVFAFDDVNPNVLLAARDQTARLVVAIDEDVRETVRVVTARGVAEGRTYAEQARVLRMVVPLRPTHALAPMRLGDEIRAGQAAAATSRRLSASDKAQIRSRIRAGTVTEDFVVEMETRYTRSLLNRRALDIARTESIRAGTMGVRQSWAQAIDAGVLSPDARRVPVVTPDDRLRETHAETLRMNIGGVRLDEPYDTPWGPMDGPPWEPNCRCGEALIFPGQVGVL